MNGHTRERRDCGFVVGLLTGTLVGAGLVMWLAPRMASELRQRVTDSANSLGRRASERYQQASARVGDAVDELTRKGQVVRDHVAEAVAHGAREVERTATAAMSDQVGEPGAHAPDRSTTARHSR